MMSTRGELVGSAPIRAEANGLAKVRAIAVLRHPHVVAMWPGADGGFEFDAGDGRSLSELLATRGSALPLRVALRILLDVLSGLSALHRADQGGKALNFVHGEVMPANIIVGSDGVARLVPLVKSHWSPASPLPPAAAGYSDVFSAGVLLWEAMAGKPLFRDVPVDDVVTQLVGGKVQPPAPRSDAPWSVELADVAMRALAVDPSDRWEHVGIMGADIETIAMGHIAKSSELIALVTGREVSRDSMSDEVTMPLASVPSLSPFSNSIPSPDGATRAPLSSSEDSTLPIETAVRSSRAPMPERTRIKIVTGALATSFVLLALAGYKKISQSPDSSETTVLVPAAQPVAPPAAAEPTRMRGPRRHRW